MKQRGTRRVQDTLGSPWHFWAGLWPFLALAVLSFGVYAGALDNGFVWDDAGQLLKNPVVVDFHKIPAVFSEDVWAYRQAEEGAESTNYYRPLQILTYMAVHAVVGFDPFAFHLVLVLLHTVNALLVYSLLRKVLDEMEAALVGAALFAAHPIHTEAVAWIAVLPDVLMTLAVLIGLVLFLRQNGSPRGWQIAAHAALYSVALLTKETGVVMLPILAGVEWFYYGRAWRELWKNRALYAALAGVFFFYAAMRVHALGGFAPAQGRHIRLGTPELVVNAIALLGRYFLKLVWPAHLSGYHAFDPVSLGSLQFWLALSAVIAVAAGIVRARRTSPAVSCGLFLIVLPLLPVMNLTGVGEAPFAERYLYLPSAGFVWVAAFAWREFWRRNRPLAWISAATVLAVLAYVAIARIPDWHDDIRLFAVTARQNPNSAHVRTMLAQSYQFQGDIGKAVDEYRIAERPGDDSQNGGPSGRARFAKTRRCQRSQLHGRLS